MDIEDIKYRFQERVSIFTVDGKRPEITSIIDAQKEIMPLMKELGLTGLQMKNYLTNWKGELNHD